MQNKERFLEELTNASPMMQSKAYGIALDKKVAGRWKLPENARVVAAGNELEDSLVANEMAEPLYDRFALWSSSKIRSEQYRI